jgi:hypothetical protein
MGLCRVQGGSCTYMYIDEKICANGSFNAVLRHMTSYGPFLDVRKETWPGLLLKFFHETEEMAR